MGFRRIPQTEISYGLISFDKQGVERTDDPDGRMSDALIQMARAQPFTNVFLFSHGWKGDVPAALDQYDRWIKAFDDVVDRTQASQAFPGFRPLYIGLHWPSQPWGDEELGGGSASFGPASGGTGNSLLQAYLDRLGDSPAIRSALQVIIDEARGNAAADTLSARVRDAYLALDKELGLGSGGLAAPPDADRGPFDPELAFAAGNESPSFGGLSLGGVLGPLRQLSYWTMKKRARSVGEGGIHTLVNALQKATSAKATRVHLMGHSFGCIVVSSALGGPDARTPLERPVDSVALVQGALSLWTYSPSIPWPNAGAGYFSRILPDAKLRGPLITTRSRHDTAVGELYPLAAQLRGSPSFAPGAEAFPEYGAVGAFGMQGLAGSIASDRPMLERGGAYGFEKGKVYNLQASQFIAKKEGASGAHSDIAGPEVAHAIWQAALASA
jgi:hypothetical protein